MVYSLTVNRLSTTIQHNTNALEQMEQEAPGNPDVAHLVDFIRHTERGIMPGDPELAALGSHMAEDTEEDD